ncbi:MAG: SLC13/DASS family transporter [Armatimonadetes bacterium]|nr:MAG: SLC13/DASS family transporter [Armatimonadota bacterium]
MTDPQSSRKGDKRHLYFALAAAAAILAGWGLQGHSQEQRAVGASFAFAVVLYLTEALPLPVTALLSVVLLVLLGGATPDAAFAAFGDKIILLFIGSFLLAKGLERTGLDLRITYALLRRPAFSRTPGHLLLTLILLATTFSFFVSNTAVAAMMMPIAIALVRRLKLSEDEQARTALPLAIAWGASVSVGVLIATPPNLIAVSLLREHTGTEISFVGWSLFAMPITILVVGVVYLILRLFFLRSLPDTREAIAMVRQESRHMGPIRASEKAVLFAFFVTLVLWLLPDLWGLVAGAESDASQWLKAHLHASVAALIGSSLLFLLPADDTESGRALSWGEAVQIDWGTILLFGGGIALGKAMFDTGLVELLGNRILEAAGVETLWGAVVLCALLALLMSELSSNTASATTMVPVALGMADSLSVSPIPLALAAAIGASLGFMLPISTPPNAIAYGTGLVRVRDMARAGFLLDVTGLAVVVFVLWLMLPLLGMA